MRGDVDPRRWDRTSGDRSGGAKKDAEKELEKPIWYDEVKVVVKKLNVQREANTISNLQTNLVAVASFRPTHQSVVLYLSISLNLSLLLPLSRSMLIFEEDRFFWLCFLLIWFIYLDFLL